MPPPAAQTLRQRAELLPLERLGILVGRLDGRDDEVGERLGVLRVHRLRVDHQGAQLAGTGHGGPYETAARLSVDLGPAQFLLGRGEVLLHLLGLLEELLHVGLTTTGNHGHSWHFDDECFGKPSLRAPRARRSTRRGATLSGEIRGPP